MALPYHMSREDLETELASLRDQLAQERRNSRDLERQLEEADAEVRRLEARIEELQR